MNQKKSEKEMSRVAFSSLAIMVIASGVLSVASEVAAVPRPCRQGLKGVYVSWDKNSSAAGTGTFTTSTGRVSVLPNFTWQVTGRPDSIKVGSAEPFSGGNSMKGIYGSADTATNLNIRIEGNDTHRRSPIPHSAVLSITFDAGTPASGWGFAVVDIDVDQVQIRATNTAGQPVPASTISRWFVQKFDANPSTDGVNIPSWDATSSAVVGSSSSSTTLRTTVEGDLDDTEAASAWFQPNVSLSELTFEYQSLQEEATPSYHVLVAACASTFTSPTPTPAASGDSDGDSIPDQNEGSGDTDNDDIPNYLDEDSDGDTVPDSQEGADDSDEDGTPDYLDKDSDGDDVPDIIERDPAATPPAESGTDNDRNGIDDGREGKTSDPLSDEDSDGAPDTNDQDSDNDGTNDGDEAYDLDGDNKRDVQPSGEDEDGDGIDDAFEDFDSPEDINRDFIGDSSEAPCSSLNLSAQKQEVLKRLTALGGRVRSFAGKIPTCGGAYPTSLVNRAAALRRSFERHFAASFRNSELVCPTKVCARSGRSAQKARLISLANQLAVYAKKSKMGAIRVCGEGPSNGKPDRRPRTEAYLAELKSEIRELPNGVSRCN